LKRELDAIGCHVPLEPHGQGYKDMSPAVDIVERLVIQRKLRARVSARDQDLASQDAELRAASRRLRQGVQGEGLGRQERPARAGEAPAQDGAQRRARALDRLARSTRDLLNILDAIAEAEASLVAG